MRWTPIWTPKNRGSFLLAPPLGGPRRDSAGAAWGLERLFVVIHSNFIIAKEFRL
jgi:hypothetical protein